MDIYSITDLLKCFQHPKETRWDWLYELIFARFYRDWKEFDEFLSLVSRNCLERFRDRFKQASMLQPYIYSFMIFSNSNCADIFDLIPILDHFVQTQDFKRLDQLLNLVGEEYFIPELCYYLYQSFAKDQDKLYCYLAARLKHNESVIIHLSDHYRNMKDKAWNDWLQEYYLVKR